MENMSEEIMNCVNKIKEQEIDLYNTILKLREQQRLTQKTRQEETTTYNMTVEKEKELHILYDKLKGLMLHGVKNG